MNGGVAAGTFGVPLGRVLDIGNTPTLVDVDDFPEEAWANHLLAQLVLADFAKTNWQSYRGEDWRAYDLATEIERLISYRNEARAQFDSEIVAQADGAPAYWHTLLTIGGYSRPYTAQLIAVGMTIGQFVGMYYKNKWNRPRPSQVFPAILPNIPTP